MTAQYGPHDTPPRRGDARAFESVLVACVREHDWGQPPPDAVRLLLGLDQRRLVALAERHRVVSAVLLSAGDALLPPIRQRLRLLSRADHLRTLQVENECRHLASALESTAWLVVKGPALARGYYRRAELRSYGDLDVLVRPQDFSEAVARLEGAGYTLLDRNWLLLRRRMSGELHVMSPRGVLVDLHWDLTNDAATRKSYAMSAQAFFERAERLTIAGIEALVLDPLDTVVHTAVHAARSGGDRLVWLKDLEQLILSGRFTWPDLAKRSAELHAQLAVSVMLHRMRAVLGTENITDADLHLLGGSRPWLAVGRLVDRLSPILRAGADGSLARIFARSTRSDSGAAAVELGRRIVARARRGTWPQEDHTWDPAHPDSPLYESGGREGRVAFLAAVSAIQGERR
ncbi:hypothetical protein DQ244_00710 [Blastococcus sp. TBT05-19]|uniref:nucleotidyltransferase domain-containing protein n=1 Tax=Blastococcus sp. TBT05-19 TaxID=2250581 RepID=UPI000DE870B5|nr:nucleotidyltransferase family protein [Blastococcus sp. TBT05-19]RBY93930.1 hypothetical protein DQ244_00710 [Blastococcus sp. TBT05-19]